MRMYICVLDEVPDKIVPTLVAHTVINAHIEFYNPDWEYAYHNKPPYMDWLENSFKKVTVRVNQKEFNKISQLSDIHIGHENNTLDAQPSCIVVCPMPNDQLPNVLKFAKLWTPNV